MTDPIHSTNDQQVERLTGELAALEGKHQALTTAATTVLLRWLLMTMSGPGVDGERIVGDLTAAINEMADTMKAQLDV